MRWINQPSICAACWDSSFRGTASIPHVLAARIARRANPDLPHRADLADKGCRPQLRWTHVAIAHQMRAASDSAPPVRVGPQGPYGLPEGVGRPARASGTAGATSASTGYALRKAAGMRKSMDAANEKSVSHTARETGAHQGRGRLVLCK